MSHGNAVRTEHRGLGAEAEAEGGMKFARSAARKVGINPLPALCEIMSGLNDTNLLYRGGEEALNYVKSEAKKLLEGDPKELEDGLRRMDRRCIEMGISPGGSADVPACAYYIHRLEALLS